MSSSKGTTKDKGAGHDSKGAGNGPGKSTPILPSHVQDEVRRAAKRRPKLATGLAALANNPHVGATQRAIQARQQQEALRKEHEEKILAFRATMVIFALQSPHIARLTNGSDAKRVAVQLINRYALKGSNGEISAPRERAKRVTKAVLGHLVDDKAFTFGVAMALRALDEAFDTVHLAVSGFVQQDEALAEAS